MAEEEMVRVAQDALARWPLVGLTVIHRFGVISPGERIVLVIAAARHRGEAFAAAEFMMDYLKTRAPFWKKERRIDGTDGGWVAARTEDAAAAARWESE
jgi:molybdopterin synthase catalytic subunit